MSWSVNGVGKPPAVAASIEQQFASGSGTTLGRVRRRAGPPPKSGAPELRMMNCCLWNWDPGWPQPPGSAYAEAALRGDGGPAEDHRDMNRRLGNGHRVQFSEVR